MGALWACVRELFKPVEDENTSSGPWGWKPVGPLSHIHTGARARGVCVCPLHCLNSRIWGWELTIVTLRLLYTGRLLQIPTIDIKGLIVRSFGHDHPGALLAGGPWRGRWAAVTVEDDGDLLVDVLVTLVSALQVTPVVVRLAVAATHLGVGVVRAPVCALTALVIPCNVNVTQVGNDAFVLVISIGSQPL